MWSSELLNELGVLAEQQDPDCVGYGLPVFVAIPNLQSSRCYR